MNSSSTLRNNIVQRRILIFFILIILVFGIFILQLFNYQILQGEKNKALAEENRISDISLPTLRGIIYDRNGIVLARNVASFNVVILPAELPDD